MKCQIKVTKEVIDIWEKSRPKVGDIYDAELSPQIKSRKNQVWKGGKAEFCVVDILDKKIVLRKGEYELVRVCG